MATYNRVDIGEMGIRSEYSAVGVVRPGDHLVKASGQVTTSVDGQSGNMFALHDKLQGKTIDDNYAADDMVMCANIPSGSRFWAWLTDEQNVSDGDPLTADGGGSLRVAVIGTDAVVAYADEDLDLTGASGDARIVVRIA